MAKISIRTYRLFTLIIPGFFIAAAGFLARVTHEHSIEHWLVFAAGLSNLIVLFDLGPKIFNETYDRSARLWLVGELVFFSAILSADINLAVGQWVISLFLFSILWFIFALIYMTYSETPQNEIGFLVSAICLGVAIYAPLLFRLLTYITTAPHDNASPVAIYTPLLFRLLKPIWEHPIVSLISSRGFPLIHLLCIPLVFLLVDTKLSINYSKWSNFLFLDRSLLWAGFACAVSGFLYALLEPVPGTPPLFESGAAALLLLVGNAWYLSVEG